MNVRPLSIILTMAVAFAGTMSFLIRRNHAASELRQPPSRVESRAGETPAIGVATTVDAAAAPDSAPGNQPAAASQAQKPVDPDPPPPDSEEEAVDLSQTLVPAAYMMGLDPNHPGTRVPMLVSLSTKTLDVTVTATNPSVGTQSLVEVTIAHGERKNLSEMGFVAQPGDRITLHSPPYRDRGPPTE